MLWKYVKQYLVFAIIAALFMVGEVLMDLLQPDIMSEIVDDGVLGLHNDGISDPHLILVKGGIMIVLVIIGGLCGAFNNAFVHISSQNIGNEMRKDCFRNIMSFSFSQMDQFGTGSLITRVTNDITQTQNMVSQFVRGVIRTSMLTLGSLYFLFILNRRFGVIVLCMVPFMVGCIIICLYKGSPLIVKLQAKLDEINDIMQEDISGIRIIKACVRETYEKIRFGKANAELVKKQLQVLVIFAFMTPVMNILMNVAVVLILLSGSYQVADGLTTPGVIMAAITYTTQLLSGISMLVMLFQNISRGVVSWGRVKEILDCGPEMENGRLKEETGQKGLIEFKNVSFAYPGTDHLVLKNINLTIYPGETLGVMGTTGCGKTTFVRLIPRFYDVTEGEILVDGINIRDYNLHALREKISVALQKSELFNAAISENISWGALTADENAIKKAAQIAQAEEFIESSPRGYETVVAERGMSLSGGQKQRLSVARAVLKPAEIYVFDDATSALDLKTEANLYAALEREKGNCTKIIVAQRIASVRNADRILILENGHMAACASHEELLESCSIYQDIYQSQLGESGGVQS